MLFLSDESFKDQQKYLFEIYRRGESDWYYLFKGLLGPFLTAVALLLVYPWPALWMYSYSAKRQLQLREKKQEIENLRLLSVEESRELIVAQHNLKIEYADSIKGNDEDIAKMTAIQNSLHGEISELKEKLLYEEQKFGSMVISHQDSIALYDRSLQQINTAHEAVMAQLAKEREVIEELKRINKKYEADNKILDAEKLRLLEYIESYPESMERTDWLRILPGNKIQNEHLIDQLLQENLISEMTNKLGGWLKVTPAGRAALVKNMQSATLAK